jgi:Protein of unknown function (DUF2637)
VNLPQWRPDPDRSILAAVYFGAALLAAFAFGVSYTHIYDLALANGQHAWAARLTPLSVDLLIVVASLVLLLQRRYDEKPDRLAKWLPRAMLYAGIAATVAANLLSGLHWTGLDPYVSAWPATVFAAVVETVFVAVSPVRRNGVKRTVIAAGQPPVPATVADAARTAYVASVAAGNPLSSYQVHKRFGITRSQAARICTPAAGKAALNGDGPHE